LILGGETSDLQQQLLMHRPVTYASVGPPQIWIETSLRAL
jgi:hypothetical protein